MRTRNRQGLWLLLVLLAFAGGCGSSEVTFFLRPEGDPSLINGGNQLLIDILPITSESFSGESIDLASLAPMRVQFSGKVETRTVEPKSGAPWERGSSEALRINLPEKASEISTIYIFADFRPLERHSISKEQIEDESKWTILVGRSGLRLKKGAP